jgi:hypothetical protein
MVRALSVSLGRGAAHFADQADVNTCTIDGYDRRWGVEASVRSTMPAAPPPVGK